MNAANESNAGAPASLEDMIKRSFGSASARSLDDDTEGLVDNSKSPERPPPGIFAVRTPHKSPSKTRSLSDTTPKLAPSPKLKESTAVSKDDHSISTAPKTPRRMDLVGSLSLSLQMPPREFIQSPNPSKNPLSPKLDNRPAFGNGFGTPAKVLPRHSRGLDFSRAATNLHHSTIAEQSSPDSSPTITQKAMMIPHRKLSINAMSVDPPSLTWSVPSGGKNMVSSSLGSVNMLGSDDSSSSDDDLESLDPEEPEDTLLTTPQVHRKTPSGGNGANIYGNGWPNLFSPAGNNFLNFQRARLKNGRSRKSSSSASGHSSVASPAPTSPPAGKANNDGGYFAREVSMRAPSSRRESLTLGTNELHISSGNDSGDESGLPVPGTPAVIRRAVTRRGNLLPKSRAFGRIRAELIDESAPIESEAKREAEVIRQVRESDVGDLSTTHSSPTFQPIASLEGIPEDGTMSLDTGATPNGKGLFGAFARNHSANAGGREFWDNFEKRTTPPPAFLPRGSSSTEDMLLESPTVSQPTSVFQSMNYPGLYEQAISEPSRSTTPQPLPPPSAVDGLRKANKRRRDDDLDGASLKRRAVSPGVSVQNSPVLSQSPIQRNDPWGSQPKVSREGSVVGGHAAGERSNSMSSVVSSTPVLGPKRIGLQGMSDMQGLTEKMTLE